MKSLRYDKRLNLADNLRNWTDEATWGPVTEEMLDTWATEINQTIKELREEINYDN